jgi:hypothetical protein
LTHCCCLLQGYLLPTYHGSYWMGLSKDANGWGWADYSPAPSADSYMHWGTDDNGVDEPNNVYAPENCAASNYSQAFGQPSAWGWSDARCRTKLPFICRTMRELLASTGCCVIPMHLRCIRKEIHGYSCQWTSLLVWAVACVSCAQ